jgi:two-component system, chemotaxis family, protein-glutamate methylesterase/glutaminase
VTPASGHEIVVVGASLGGLAALKTILHGLRPDFPLPIAIAQHRAEWTTGDPAGLTSLLQRHSAIPVLEPDDKQPLLHGHLYLAPAAYHLLVERRPGGAAPYASLTTDAPVQHARPSIDVLFESAAESFGPRAIAVVLTAGSEDGLQGAVEIKRRGGLLLVQDPATAESRILPDAVLAAVQPDAVLPVPKIAPYLALTCAITQRRAASSVAAPPRRLKRAS